MSFVTSQYAPKGLIEEIDFLDKQLQERKIRLKRFLAEIKEHGVVDQHGYAKQLRKEILELNNQKSVLAKLVTCHEMDSVWKELNKKAMRDRFFKSCKLCNRALGESGWSIYLWTHIASSMKDFDRKISDTRTPAVRRKELKSIADKIGEIIKMIEGEPYANILANHFLQDYFGLRNLHFRKEWGEDIPRGEYWMPSLAMSGDCHEAKEIVESMELNTHEKYVGWHKSPLIARLYFWTEMAQEVAISDLLSAFRDELKLKSDERSEIPRPSLGEDARKSFLIRRMSAFMKEYYDQPLDEIVAKIVSTVLDISPALSRDDVRPYLLKK